MKRRVITVVVEEDNSKPEQPLFVQVLQVDSSGIGSEHHYRLPWPSDGGFDATWDCVTRAVRDFVKGQRFVGAGEIHGESNDG